MIAAEGAAAGRRDGGIRIERTRSSGASTCDVCVSAGMAKSSARIAVGSIKFLLRVRQLQMEKIINEFAFRTNVSLATAQHHQAD